MSTTPTPSATKNVLLARQQYGLLATDYPAPDAADSKYIRHTAQIIDKRMFNGLNRTVRRVAIAGVHLALDKKDRDGLVATYSGKDDITEIYLLADTIVIGAPLVFPGTNVFVIARELRLTGDDSSINTQPKESTWRDPLKKDGLSGAKGGDISVYVCNFIAEGKARSYFSAVGGKGQNPDGGGVKIAENLKHLKPITAEDWDHVFSYSNRRLIHEEGSHGGVVGYWSEIPYPSWEKYNRECGGGGKIVYVEINNRHYCDAFHGRTSDQEVIASVGTKSDTGTGGDALPPGIPGIGGAGGKLRCTAELKPGTFDLRGGPSGSQHPGTPGGPAGTPNPAYWVIISGTPDRGNHNINTAVTAHAGRPGKSSGKGPLAGSPTGPSGSFVQIERKDLPLLVPTLFNVVLQYAKDCVVTAHAKLAENILKPYIDALRGSKDELESNFYAPWRLSAEVLGNSLTQAQLKQEAETLLKQAHSYVDAYGNPSGWVPGLSLEAAVGIYEGVLQNSLQELYSGYYLEKAWNDKADKTLAVKNLVEAIGARTKDAQKSMAEARSQVRPLMDDLEQLIKEMDGLAKDLSNRDLELRQEADFKLLSQEQKEAVAAGFKISGALLKALPLPEPYQSVAAGVGSVFDMTSSFIENGGDDKAFKSLKEEVGKFADRPELLSNLTRDLDADIAGTDRSSRDLLEAADHTKQARADIDAVYGRQLAALDSQKSAEEAFLKIKAEEEKIVQNAKDKKSPEWIAIEKKRAIAEAELKNQNQKVANIEQEIATRKGALEVKKADLTAKKKERETEVKTRMQQVKNIAGSIETIGNTINKLMVSPSQLNSKYDQVMAGLKSADSRFLSITQQIAYLTEKKMEITTRFLKVQSQLATEEAVIQKNLVVTNELRSQLEKSAGVLDPSALAYIQSLSQDAHRDLQKFLYFVVKAYEYYMVQPYRQSYLTAQKTFEDLRRVLEPFEFKIDFPAETGQPADETPEARKKRLEALIKQPTPAKLTEKDFELLKLVYEKPLREMGKELAGQLMTGASRLMDTKKHITLTAENLQELNNCILDPTRVNSMPFNLLRLRQVEAGRERQRIKNIKVVSATCSRLGDRFPDQMIFKFTHTGKSIVRAGGRFFAFEPEAKNTGGRAATRVSFQTEGGKMEAAGWVISSSDPKQGSLSANSFSQPTIASQENLLQRLLKSKDLITLSELRPGVFSDFELSVDFLPTESKVTFVELSLDIELEMGNASEHEVLVCMWNNVGLDIPIEVSQDDKSGSRGGLGNYVGVYDGGRLKQNPVCLTVPESFGKYVHTGWLVDGSATPGKGHSLDVFKSCYIVANYAETKSAP